MDKDNSKTKEETIEEASSKLAEIFVNLVDSKEDIKKLNNK